MSQKPVLLEVEDLKVHFPIYGGLTRRQVGSVKAVDGISFAVRAGETLGLVGESGCGKSTLGRAIVGIYEPTGGVIRLDGQDLAGLRGADRRKQARRVQIIFQDPFASLDPRMTVSRIVAEPLRFGAARLEARAIRARVLELLELVGLDPDHIDRYPHEFSGGQRQRIAIARALAPRPELVVCDEAISALDVSIQAQIVNLLDTLQDELDLTLLFIAHDLSVVRHISDRIAVMYLGRVMELSSSDDLYANTLHPYSQALLSAVPVPDPVLERQRQAIVLTGDVPSPIKPPSGCVFRTRCPQATTICAEQVPPLREITADHWAACHLV